MPGSDNSNRILIIIIIVVLVLGGAGAGWYFVVHKPAQDAEKARIAQEQAEKKRLAQEAQNKARYDQLIIEADSAFNSEDWEGAFSLYSEASGLLPSEQYPIDQLAIVDAKLEESRNFTSEMSPTLIETIDQPTQRYYVIISSSLDDDLAQDYATKLANEGTQVKIIEHKAGKHSFFGVSVAEYDTFDAASAAIPSFSSMGEAWVLKW